MILLLSTLACAGSLQSTHFVVHYGSADEAEARVALENAESVWRSATRLVNGGLSDRVHLIVGAEALDVASRPALIRLPSGAVGPAQLAAAIEALVSQRAELAVHPALGPWRASPIPNGTPEIIIDDASPVGPVTRTGPWLPVRLALSGTVDAPEMVGVEVLAGVSAALADARGRGGVQASVSLGAWTRADLFASWVGHGAAVGAQAWAGQTKELSSAPDLTERTWRSAGAGVGMSAGTHLSVTARTDTLRVGAAAGQTLNVRRRADAVAWLHFGDDLTWIRAGLGVISTSLRDADVDDGDLLQGVTAMRGRVVAQAHLFPWPHPAPFPPRAEVFVSVSVGAIGGNVQHVDELSVGGAVGPFALPGYAASSVSGETVAVSRAELWSSGVRLPVGRTALQLGVGAAGGNAWGYAPVDGTPGERVPGGATRERLGGVPVDIGHLVIGDTHAGVRLAMGGTNTRVTGLVALPFTDVARGQDPAFSAWRWPEWTGFDGVSRVRRAARPRLLLFVTGSLAAPQAFPLVGALRSSRLDR